MNKQLNLLLLLFLGLFLNAQDDNNLSALFQNEEPLKIKLNYSKNTFGREPKITLIVLCQKL